MSKLIKFVGRAPSPTLDNRSLISLTPRHNYYCFTSTCCKQGVSFYCTTQLQLSGPRSYIVQLPTNYCVFYAYVICVVWIDVFEIKNFKPHKTSSLQHSYGFPIRPELQRSEHQIPFQ